MNVYDKGFKPPAIVLSATLAGAVHTRPRVRAQALLDTGADITAIPANLEHKLKLYHFSDIELEDARGFKEPVQTYEVRLTIADHSPLVMEVVLTHLPFVLLGRDWLQHYYLLLNGPEQQFRLSDKPLNL